MIRLEENMTVIQCERCNQVERVTWQEAQERGTPVLCSDCLYRPIQTAAGGPIHWAVCDALFTLKWELERLGRFKHCDTDLWLALRRAYAKMGEASYLTDRDRGAWVGWEGMNDDDD